MIGVSFELKLFAAQSQSRSLMLFSVLCVIKLNKYPVPFRFRSGSGKLKLCYYFTMYYDIYERCT